MISSVALCNEITNLHVYGQGLGCGRRNERFCKGLLNLNNNSSEIMNVMHKSVTKVHGIKLTEFCRYTLNNER